MNKADWIKRYAMIPHEEGGYYAEIWRAETGAASHIYYLLPAGETALWHRIRGEELWLYHSGGPLEITFGGTGATPRSKERLVLDKRNIHCLIPAGTWQTACAKEDDVFVSCIVSPAFTETDWELYKESPTWTKE